MEVTPKRKYVLTEARLRANRANLEKARAVSRDIRFRSTEKRLAANRANLRKARERALAEGATLRDGMSCRSLEASLASAGETREALETTLKRFEILFQPEDGIEARVVRGLAEASWRRLRAFRVRARWERRRLLRVLQAFARRRRAREERANCGGPSSPAAPQDDSEERAHGTPTVPWLPEQGRAADPDYRSRLEQWMQEVRQAAETRECVLWVLGVFYECARMWKNIQTLNRRITCLVRVLLSLKQAAHGGLNLERISEKTMDRVLGQSSEAMGNPLLAPSQLAASQKPCGAVKPRRRRARAPGTRELRSAPPDNPEAWRELFAAALGALDEEERELVVRIAHAAWERRKLFQDRAEKEPEELEQILSAPARKTDAAALGWAATKMVRLFGDELAIMDEAEKLVKQLAGCLEMLRVTRCRKVDPVRRAESLWQFGREGATAAVNAELGVVV